MKIEALEKLTREDHTVLPSSERRNFLKLGLVVTGMYLGGSILSLTSVRNVYGSGVVPEMGKYPFNPHYTMVIREKLCVDCERCKKSCVKTNHVPEYGFRTTILEKRRSLGQDKFETVFMPVLCNHCNRPPCVRVCPTTATWKDEKNGIVLMNPGRCIGCKTCLTACPYNARYFNEETRSVDKCDFCLNSRLSKGDVTTACVEACPTSARIFGNLADSESSVFKMLHAPETTIWVLRPETGANPNVFYINS